MMAACCVVELSVIRMSDIFALVNVSGSEIVPMCPLLYLLIVFHACIS